MSNPCETCKHQGVSIADQPCASCCNSHASNWQPMPAPPEPGGLTVGALDAVTEAVLNGGFPDTRTAAAAMLRALRSLVEAKECKRAVMDAGCGWNVSSTHWGRTDCKGILLRDTQTGEEKSVATWPEARDWAEAQAAKRKPRRSPRVMSMCESEARELALDCGAREDTAVGSWWDVLRGAARGGWDPATDTIRLLEATP